MTLPNSIIAKRWEIIFRMRREKVRRFLKEGLSFPEIAEKMHLEQPEVVLLANSLTRA